jgi:hypothetical protein
MGVEKGRGEMMELEGEGRDGGEKQRICQFGLTELSCSVEPERGGKIVVFC